MSQNDDNTDLYTKLLSSLDLEEAALTVIETVLAICGAQSAAVLVFDPDLESFPDRFYQSPQRKDLIALCEAFLKTFEQDSDALVQISRHGEKDDILSPAFCYKLADEERFVACLIIAGIGSGSVESAVAQSAKLPIAKALRHAWEYTELKRENMRLRSQYEEIEGKTSMLEDQTIKLIHDLTSRDAIRTRQVERERLVYWISNAVRSSVHIQQVLETTVEKIGTTLGVSRCLLLRSLDGLEQQQVFEFTQKEIPSVKELFHTENGREFTKVALSSTIPQDLIDPDHDTQSKYDRKFLQQLGIRSGLTVPLVMRESVLGVLFLQDCRETRAWSIDDISLIGSLADNLSVAIENADLHAEREMQATTDGLTGVANRRSFNEMLAREFERARRYGEPLSLIVIDLDHLKKINDTQGHQMGDRAIRSLGLTLKQSCRSVDLPARYGGEEFCLLLPNTDITMAEQLAERLRRLINEAEVPGVGQISASLGVANYPLHADDPDLLFTRADEALYQAKQAGRNQIKVAANSAAAQMEVKMTTEHKAGQSHKPARDQSANTVVED